MKGTIITRTRKDGSKGYTTVFRAGGKQQWKTFAKRKDADKFLTTTVKTVQDGTYQTITPAPMTDVLSTWLTDSLDVRRQLDEVKPSTAKSYASIVETHFVPAFGDYRSDQLTAATVAKWRKTMAAQVESGKLSRKTFNNVLTLLRTILAWARHPAQHYLAHDPLLGQKRLQVPRVEADFLEDSDIKKLLDAVASTPDQDALISLALFAGLRRGELFGLQWSDVDFGDGKTGGKIHVRRSLYQGAVTTPKSAHSTRRIDVPQRVLDALTRHQATYPPMAGDVIFRTDAGTPVDPDNFYKRTFAGIRTRAKLRLTVGLHTLRHSYASLLIRQNESPKYISSQLGHASIQITMDTYGHLFKSTSSLAMRRLNKLIPERAQPRAAKAGLRVVGGRG